MALASVPGGPVRVLLVERDPDVVDLVTSLLALARTPFTVATAPDAQVASAALRSRPCDLILLGLVSPRVDDADPFAEIPALGHAQPVVVLGAVDDEDLAVEAVHHGAQDYLAKDRLTVDLLVRSIRYARERHHLLAEQTRRLEHELRVAALVQRSFLPSSVPSAPGHDIGAYLHASGQVGGDFYDFIRVAPDRIAVALGDASGKGIPGAILMAETQGVLRAEAAQCARPIDLVRTLNRALLHDRNQDRFVTLFYGVLTMPTGEFTFVNAGHPRALLLRDGEESTLASTGPPLRLFADAEWEEQTVTLGAGAWLVIYSDGVTEAQDDADRFFDLAGVRDVMAQHAHCTAGELARRICYAAEQFEVASPDQGDDKTVVVLRGLGP